MLFFLKQKLISRYIHHLWKGGDIDSFKIYPKEFEALKFDDEIIEINKAYNYPIINLEKYDEYYNWPEMRARIEINNSNLNESYFLNKYQWDSDYLRNYLLGLNIKITKEARFAFRELEQMVNILNRWGIKADYLELLEDISYIIIYPILADQKKIIESKANKIKNLYKEISSIYQEYDHFGSVAESLTKDISLLLKANREKYKLIYKISSHKRFFGLQNIFTYQLYSKLKDSSAVKELKKGDIYGWISDFMFVLENAKKHELALYNYAYTLPGKEPIFDSSIRKRIKRGKKALEDAQVDSLSSSFFDKLILSFK